MLITVVVDFQKYAEGTPATGEAHEGFLPLEEGVLTSNIGVPVIFVCNKV